MALRRMRDKIKKKGIGEEKGREEREKWIRGKQSRNVIRFTSLLWKKYRKARRGKRSKVSWDGETGRIKKNLNLNLNSWRLALSCDSCEATSRRFVSNTEQMALMAP